MSKLLRVGDFTLQSSTRFLDDDDDDDGDDDGDNDGPFRWPDRRFSCCCSC